MARYRGDHHGIVLDASIVALAAITVSLWIVRPQLPHPEFAVPHVPLSKDARDIVRAVTSHPSIAVPHIPLSRDVRDIVRALVPHPSFALPHVPPSAERKPSSSSAAQSKPPSPVATRQTVGGLIATPAASTTPSPTATPSPTPEAPPPTATPPPTPEPPVPTPTAAPSDSTDAPAPDADAGGDAPAAAPVIAAPAPAPPAPVPPAPVPPAPVIQAPRVVYAQTVVSASLRNGPSTAALITSFLPAGTTVAVIGCYANCSWLLVETSNGGQAWSASFFYSVEGSLAGVGG